MVVVSYAAHPHLALTRSRAEGMRLLNFNVEAQCTPSRSALMTGRFSIRSGTYDVPIGGAPDGMTQWEVTIAELLSAKGYATGMWGKWHLGSARSVSYASRIRRMVWHPAHLRRGHVAVVQRNEKRMAIRR